ncbi:MAG: hypothetical protein AAFX94_14065, partial [Myxococcota bacterium]
TCSPASWLALSKTSIVGAPRFDANSRGGGGATEEDVALMREVVGPELGVKASGGIRSAEDARKMIAAGANRLGASSSVAIVTGAGKQGTDAY